MTELDAERDVLEAQVERDERDLRRAFDDLKEVWSRPLRTLERIASHPTPWLFSAILIGVWLGSRNGNHTTEGPDARR
jgi:hypothetical protein